LGWTSWHEKEILILSSPDHPDWLWSPPCLLFSGYQWLFFL